MIQQNLARLSKLDAVRNYTYTVDQVSGEEFSVDQVVEIFNRVNSQGTPLTKADLALAHVCSIWPEAREELRAFSLKMGAVGFGVNLGFLVRCMAGVATGSIVLEGTFMRTPATELKSAWHDMQPAFEHLVGVLRHEAFIGNLSDLPTDNVLVPVIIFLARHNGTFPSETIKRRFVRWFHLAGLWARYSGSTETKLQQDVVLVTGSDLDPTHELEAAILRERGRVALEEGDLDGAGISSAVALLGHVVARSRDARDCLLAPVSMIRRLERVMVPSTTTYSEGSSQERRDNRQQTDQRGRHRVILCQKPSLSHRKATPADYLPEIDGNHLARCRLSLCRLTAISGLRSNSSTF